MRFVPVVGNTVVRLVGGRRYSTICPHVGRGMEREGWGASQRYERRGLGEGGGGREEAFVMNTWRSLDWMLSRCCFEVTENDRLVFLCLFAVAQVSWWTRVGEGGGGGKERAS